MGRDGITYEMVAEAAKRLVAAGVNPTNDAVRVELGNRGSKGTISPLLRKWREGSENVTESASKGLPADLIDVVRTVYERLEAAAQARIEQMRTECDEVRQDASRQIQIERQQKEAEKEAAALLSKDLKTLQFGHTVLEANLSNERGVRQEREVQIASLLAEKEGLLQRVADRAAEVHGIGVQLEQSRTQFEHYQEKTAEQRLEERRSYEARISALERELQLARNDSQAHREALAETRANKAALETRVAELVDAAKGHAHLLNEATAALSRAGKLESEQEVRIKMMEEWLRDSKKSGAELAEEMRVITKENAQLATMNGNLQKTVDAVERQLKEEKEKAILSELIKQQEPANTQKT
jgi:hypothetical protein